jgi:hypothetical protein
MHGFETEGGPGWSKTVRRLISKDMQLHVLTPVDRLAMHVQPSDHRDTCVRPHDDETTRYGERSPSAEPAGETRTVVQNLRVVARAASVPN